MLKGSQKQMIVVRTRDSRVFEEAYFVMRRGAERGADEMDMLWEANRIIESSLPADRRQGALPCPAPNTEGWLTPATRRFLWFLGGLVSGGGVTGLLWWLL